MIKVTIPAPETGVLVMALRDGSWGDVNDAAILHLTDEEHEQLCEGSEMHHLDPDPTATVRFAVQTLTPALERQVRKALEGDSNDAEHDALAALATACDVEYQPRED
jgi:hypothetical protein